MNDQPTLGMSPRKTWLRNRISECVAALHKLEVTEDWDLYLDQALKIANEINYAATEWEKYYFDNK